MKHIKTYKHNKQDKIRKAKKISNKEKMRMFLIVFMYSVLLHHVENRQNIEKPVNE